jgi:inhibitor of the pro-sigma K processing machinery
MTVKIILSYAFGLILLYLIGMLLVVPIKMLIKLVWNGILGGILLFIVNLIGNFIGISLAINPITALITGFLGIPGVILLLILQNIL